MTAPRPDGDERDAALDAAWRSHLNELPPPRIDAAILASAHREAGARPRRVDDPLAGARAPSRAWWGLAAAATIGAVAFGIAQLAPQETLAPTTASDAPASALSREAPQPSALPPSTAQHRTDETRPQTTLAERRDAPAAAAGDSAGASTALPSSAAARDGLAAPESDARSDAPSSARADAKVRQPSPLREPPATAQTFAVPAAPPPAAQQLLPATPPATAAAPAPPSAPRGEPPAAPQRAEAMAQAPAAGAIAPTPAPSTMAAPAPASPPASLEPRPFPGAPSQAARERSGAATAMRAAPADQAGAGRRGEFARDSERKAAPAPLSPTAWIERIATLLDAGQREAAERELNAFRDSFADADARLPERLRDWAASVPRKR